MEEQNEFSPETEQQEIVEPTRIEPLFYTEKKISFWGEFGLLIAFLGSGIIAGSVLSVIIVKIMSPHIHLLELDKEILNPANANAMKVMQLVSTIFMFLIPALMLGFVVHKKPLPYLGFNFKITWEQVVLVVFIAVMALVAGSLLGDLNEKIPISKHLQDYFKNKENEYAEQIMAIAQIRNFSEYLIALFIIALAPAIVEETFFRGAMQQLFVNWFRNPWLGIIVTSVIFSAIHFSYYGFLTRAMLGIVLGLLFYYGKSIWLNILAHFLNNAAAVSQLYYYSVKGKLTKDSLNDHYPYWLGLSAVVILYFLLIIFKKRSEEHLAKDNLFLSQNNIA